MKPAVDSTLEEQIRECFGRVAYSHKTHECMSDRANEVLKRYRIGQIALTGLTSAGAVTVLFSNDGWAEVATAALAFLTFFASTFLKDFDLGSVAQKHAECAAKLWAIREDYLSLLTDFSHIARSEAAERRDKLQSRLAAVYEGAPRTDAKAYSCAQDRLKNKEDLTFSPAEIDHFLPATLHRATPVDG